MCYVNYSKHSDRISDGARIKIITPDRVFIALLHAQLSYLHNIIDRRHRSVATVNVFFFLQVLNVDKTINGISVCCILVVTDKHSGAAEIPFRTLFDSSIEHKKIFFFFYGQEKISSNLSRIMKRMVFRLDASSVVITERPS